MKFTNQNGINYLIEDDNMCEINSLCMLPDVQRGIHKTKATEKLIDAFGDAIQTYEKKLSEMHCPECNNHLYVEYHHDKTIAVCKCGFHDVIG